MSKPIIKWIGGKNQIKDKILSNFPDEINNYHEIFVGGGSILISLLHSNIKINGKVYAYDLNCDLINLYQNIKNNPNNLYEETIKLKNKYFNLNEMKDKSLYYYECRDRYREIVNTKTIENSALFLFLNKTCFRGLYRTSKKSGFNSPFGNYKKPNIIDKNELLKLSKLFEKVEFIQCDFREAFNNLEAGDFLYLDPPYYPLTKTSFTKYNEGDFKKEDHDDLFLLCRGLVDVNFLLSNHKVSYVLDIFNGEYDIEVINCKRAIHSKNPESRTDELLIKNIFI